MRVVKILTRDSALALTQAEMVRTALAVVHPQVLVEIHPTKALGDKYRDQWESFVSAHPGSDEITKRKWTFELEEAIAAGDYDIAMHSGKDLPHLIRADTSLMPVLRRADARDVLITRGEDSLAALLSGSIIGTGSLRRRSQLLRLRSDLTVQTFNGNVPTRLRKLSCSGHIGGIILAAAGLERLAGEDVESLGLKIVPLSYEDFVPAVNQGILVAQYQTGNEEIEELLRPIVDPATFSAWEAERSCVEALEASCETAIGVYAEMVPCSPISASAPNYLRLLVRGLANDGTRIIEESVTGTAADSSFLGRTLGLRLREQGILEL